jgi:hypothetical protein
MNSAHALVCSQRSDSHYYGNQAPNSGVLRLKQRRADLEMGHEHHVTRGVEVVADGPEEDGAQHCARLCPLVPMPSVTT